MPPAGRGVLRLVNAQGKGRCAHCLRSLLLRLDGTVINHPGEIGLCPGSTRPPAEDVPVASWLPVLRGLTPHGLRHGHETWLEAAKVPYVLISERMGHEVSGMRGTYSHVTPAMRAEAKLVLQGLWEESLKARAEISRRSLVPTLDALLQAL